MIESRFKEIMSRLSYQFLVDICEDVEKSIRSNSKMIQKLVDIDGQNGGITTRLGDLLGELDVKNRDNEKIKKEIIIRKELQKRIISRIELEEILCEIKI